MGQLAFISSASEASELSRHGVVAPAVSIFASPETRTELSERCRAAGFAIAGGGVVSSLTDATAGVLGEIVVVVCTAPSAVDIAALCRLDERAWRAGARVIAVTDDAGLDMAFGCFERASSQFLVDPRPGEFGLALVRALPAACRSRVRELDEAERLALLRLTEEVGRLAAKLDSLALPLGADRQAEMSGRLASPGLDYRAEDARDPLRRPKPPLPDPRLVHRIIRQRRLRDRYFEGELFADPAWDILLDLTAARAEHRRVCVTSLCIAAAVPPTTALRWIQQMTEMGVLIREQDPEDRRRAFIVLADPVADAMARYFDEIGQGADKQV